MSDDQATHLADLAVKRNRTLADLDAVQQAMRSTRKSIDGFVPKHDQIMQPYLDRLDSPTDDGQLRTLFKEIEQVFRKEIAMFREILAEWERLQVQERILVQMLLELDHQIDEASDALSES